MRGLVRGQCRMGRGSVRGRKRVETVKSVWDGGVGGAGGVGSELRGWFNQRMG